MQTIQYIDEVNRNARLVILAGDFNTSEQRNDLDVIIGLLKHNRYRDAWTKTRGSAPEYKWDSSINLWAKKTNGNNLSKHRFDYFFIRDGGDFLIRVKKASIVFDAPIRTNDNDSELFLSDHFGITTELSFDLK